MLFDINHSIILFDLPPRIITIKAKIKQWDLIKLKSFCTTKKTIKKNEKTIYRMGEILCKRCNQQRLNLQNIQTTHTTQEQENNPIEKWTDHLNRHFSKENIWIAREQMKKNCSTSLIREMQIKTTMGYDLTPVRMAISNKFTNNKCWRGCGEKGILLHCW